MKRINTNPRAPATIMAMVIIRGVSSATCQHIHLCPVTHSRGLTSRSITALEDLARYDTGQVAPAVDAEDHASGAFPRCVSRKPNRNQRAAGKDAAHANEGKAVSELGLVAGGHDDATDHAQDHAEDCVKGSFPEAVTRIDDDEQPDNAPISMRVSLPLLDSAV